jgi:cyclopropane fatty-acyl-phospholipid synthase-like methyltransferase
MQPERPVEYWERAGEVGYAAAMYSSQEVATYVQQRTSRVAICIGAKLGLTGAATVLELGCGDGAFAIQYLAPAFQRIYAYDLSNAGIERARASCPSPNVRFEAADVTRVDVGSLGNFDGAFLIGFLHHVKPAAARIMSGLAKIAPRVVILEPNGNNLVRKLLELTPSYRSAGEDSFTVRELKALFAASGYDTEHFERINLFPNFTPRPLFRLLRPVEPWIERNHLLNGLCTVNMIGLKRRAG